MMFEADCFVTSLDRQAVEAAHRRDLRLGTGPRSEPSNAATSLRVGRCFRMDNPVPDW